MRADDFRAQIFFAANPVVQFFRDRIVKQTVHGEIAARGIARSASANVTFLRPPAVAGNPPRRETWRPEIAARSPTTMMTPNFSTDGDWCA
jgi:hypothetical protein